ncbi:MAG: hypothetical protein ACW99F_17945 [Candidatus Hodarchaeales archaeon]|jgi:hypothetical protein
MDVNVGDYFIPTRKYLSSRLGRLCTVCKINDDHVWWRIEGVTDYDGNPHADRCGRANFTGFLLDTGSVLISVLREPDWEI